MEAIYIKIKNTFLKILSLRMLYNGYTIKSAMKWKRNVLSDFFKNFKTNIFYKIQSYCWGYLPFQRKILNITKENKSNFISYKKYLYLNGANGKYNKWLADSITTNKVLKQFENKMPKLYYHMYIRDGKMKIISLQKGLKNSEKDVIAFIKQEKELLLTSSEKRRIINLEYKNNYIYLNDVKLNEKEFLKYITGELYNIRSFIIMEKTKSQKDFKIDNQDLKLIIKMYNPTGTDPEIGEMFYSINMDHNIINDIDDEILKDFTMKIDYVNEKNNERIKNKTLNGPRVYFDENTGKFKLYCKENEETLTLTKKIDNEDKKPIKLVENNFESIKNLISDIFKTIPQIELAEIHLTLTDDGIKILNILNNPSYCDYLYFNKKFSDFLLYKYDQKRQMYKGFKFKFNIFRKKVYLKICKLVAILFYPKGLVPYISLRWLKDIKDDFKENKNIPLKTKLWAYRHGFLSYRLAQYGITKDNYKNFISDFEYKWLRHIDNYYKVWFEDKITIKYVAKEYNEYFPKYYYFITLKQGENKIIPLMDCPKELGNTYDDIFKLVKKEKDIALKRDKGSHGEGFYRLSYKNNKLYLNLEEASEQDVIDILADKNNEYLVTEYIKQHDILNKIYDGAVNTIRIIAYKKDGINTTIGNTYMRFGSKKTGTVDNIGAGGIYVKVDKEDGHFHDALIITDDLKIVECKKHPDSKLKIDGYIPHWDKILKDITEIANSLEQIEYFGFDIAVTDNGIKFPEINRYPDYMKIGKLKQESIDYLLHKVEEKKKRYGYDKKMPHKLIKFIDRRNKVK